MVFYSIKSNEKVFHLPHCNVNRRIRKEYKKQFFNEEEARIAGYRMCNCCSVVGARLKKEQEAVNQFCQQNGVACWHEDGQIHIQTPESKWKIITSGKGNKLFLYHKNAFHKEDSIPSIVPGYHSQAARSKTIVGYLDYIVQHDAYWKRQKKKAKKKAESMKNLRRNTRRYQRGTDNQRYNANQLYSIMESVYL